MSIEKIYDKAVKHYSQDVSAEVLDKSNKLVIDFIAKHYPQIKKILALGIGDGFFLVPYMRAYPKAKLAGLDISVNMLEKAKKTLGCETHHGGIAEASSIVQDKDFDLLMAHFVCAYVTPHEILRESKKLLKKGGYLSLVSNVEASFPKMHSLYQNYVSQKGFLRSYLKKHIDQSLETVTVPKDVESFVKQVEQEGYSLLQKESLTIEVSFDDAESLYQFFVGAGWFANGLVHSLLPVGVIKFIFKRLIKKLIQFPCCDALKIAVITAKY